MELTAPIGRITAAGAVGQQIEKFRIALQIFCRPFFKTVGIVLFREITVAPVTYQPNGFVMHIITCHFAIGPVCHIAPLLTPEEKAEFGFGDPIAALEIKGFGPGDDFSGFAGEKPTDTVGIFQYIINGKKCTGCFHQQSTEVVAAVVAGDDKFFVVADDPGVVVFHAGAGNIVCFGKLSFAK